MTASPPFNISETTPGDSDIVSQFPNNERTNRDTIESWLKVNHDTSGQHFMVDMPMAAAPASPASSVIRLFMDTTGHLRYKNSAGTSFYVGAPPGSVFFVAGALPNGFLEADGSAVSRSVFADLFGVTGVTFGIGDGSTTFNLPDLRGRVPAGIDSGGLRLTAAGFGSVGSFAASGGSEVMTILTANLPPYTPAGFIANGAITFPSTVVSQNFGTGSSAAMLTTSIAITGTNMTSVMGPVQASSTFTGTAQGGTSTATKNVQPTLILRAVIAY